ncbi:hypothetical protein EJB05_36914, partial [Eragrostis curvula]
MYSAPLRSSSRRCNPVPIQKPPPSDRKSRSRDQKFRNPLPTPPPRRQLPLKSPPLPPGLILRLLEPIPRRKQDRRQTHRGKAAAAIATTTIADCCSCAIIAARLPPAAPTPPRHTEVNARGENSSWANEH